MKKLLIILVAVVLGVGGCAPVYGPGYGPVYGAGYGPPPSAGIVVAVGDRPYYTRGPYYIHQGRRYVWVNGHWAHRHGRRVWVHGHYVRRG
ncbi:hypothetical protein BH20VER3_BH20VER3_19320 [soil metagenome]